MTVFHNPKPEEGGQKGWSEKVVRNVGQKDPEKAFGENAEKMRRKYGENAEKVFRSIKANLFIKTHEIADQAKLSQRTVENAVLKLKNAGLLKRVGPDKGGHWEVHN